MKKEESKAFTAGEKIHHWRYGICRMQAIVDCGSERCGVIIRPQTDDSKLVLSADSGKVGLDFLELNTRQIIALP